MTLTTGARNAWGHTDTWSRRNPAYRAQNLVDRASAALGRRRWERTGLR